MDAGAEQFATFVEARGRALHAPAPQVLNCAVGTVKSTMAKGLAKCARIPGSVS